MVHYQVSNTLPIAAGVGHLIHTATISALRCLMIKVNILIFGVPHDKAEHLDVQYNTNCNVTHSQGKQHAVLYLSIITQ